MAEPGEGDYGGMSEAQRNAIVAALLAQASAPTTMYGDSVAGDLGTWPADPSDPADYSAAPAVENAGYVSNAPGHLTDAATNPEGTLGSVLGNPNAGMPAPSMNAPTTSDLTAASLNAPTGNFGPAPTGSRTASDFAATHNAFDVAASPGRSVAGNVVDATAAPVTTSTISPGYPATTETFGPPAPGLFDQGLTFGGRNIAGHNIAGPFNAFEGAPQAQQAQQAAPGGYDQGAAIAADIAGLSSLNADVNAAVNAAYGPGEVTGPVATGAPATGTPATGTPASTDVAVGYGIGLGLGDAVGGYGGATGDGTSGGFGGEAGGPGVGGSSTGISGGPGGTGEGGANTGEGGTGVSGGFGGGEGGGGGGAGGGAK